MTDQTTRLITNNLVQILIEKYDNIKHNTAYLSGCLVFCSVKL